MSIGTKLAVAKTAITSKGGRQVLLARKNSPTILFVGGIVGVVGTVVLSSKATLKLESVLSENEKKQEQANDLVSNDPTYTAKDYTKDMATLKVRLATDVVRLYAPSVVLGVLSVGALTGSHVTLTRRNTAIMAAYATVDQSFKDYRKRVIAKYGKDVDEQLRFETKEELVQSTDSDGNIVSELRAITGYSQYARFFDESCRDWQATPEKNYFFLRSQQQWANDMLKARGHVLLNEVYDALDIPRTKEGLVVGWVSDSKHGDNYIDFGFMDGDNPRARDFVNGREASILLDFNVDGLIYNEIGK